jgi:hypothetical protein
LTGSLKVLPLLLLQNAGKVCAGKWLMQQYSVKWLGKTAPQNRKQKDADTLLQHTLCGSAKIKGSLSAVKQLLSTKQLAALLTTCQNRLSPAWTD